MSSDVKRKGDAGLPPARGASAALRQRVGHLAAWVMVLALVGSAIAGVLPPPFSFPGAASAAPSSLALAQEELKEAKAELTAEQERLDKLAQKQADAETRVEKTRASIAKVQAKADDAEASLAKLRARFADRLADIYKNRGSEALNMLSVIFADEDTSVGTIVGRLTLVAHIAESDSQLIADMRDTLAELDELAAELAAQQAKEQKEAAQLAAAQADTLQALEDSKDTYNTLRARVAALEEEERRRQEEARKAAAAKAAAEKAAAEKAAAEKAAAAKAAAEARRNATTSTTKAKTTSTTTGGSTGTIQTDSADPIDTGDGWVFPVQGPNSFVDTWGAPRSGGRSHKGTDIMTARDTPLVAVVDGVILKTNPTDAGLGGITIHLKGDDGNTYYYAHLASIEGGIKKGVRVKAGQVIGYAGNTGNASGGAAHLHFGIYPGGGAAINPYPILIKYR